MISSHTLLDIRLLIHAETRINPYCKRDCGRLFKNLFDNMRSKCMAQIHDIANRPQSTGVCAYSFIKNSLLLSSEYRTHLPIDSCALSARTSHNNILKACQRKWYLMFRKLPAGLTCAIGIIHIYDATICTLTNNGG